MKKLLACLLTITSLSFAYINCVDLSDPEDQWCYSQSTLQAFYYFDSVIIDGSPAAEGDIVSAWLGDALVGWFAVPEECETGCYTVVPAMGNDGPGHDDYCSPGDVPYFKVYDVSNDAILDGTPVDVVPGWGINSNFILTDLNASNSFGCTDPSSCNYDADATADSGCVYPTGCNDVCYSDAVVDECGVCDGDGIADGACDCSGNVLDCGGICGGSNTTDGCGVCNSDSSDDNATCTGCTDDVADNYGSGNLFDDGSCEYTVPSVGDLSASGGPERVILPWTAPDPMGTSSYSYDVLDPDGSVVKDDLVGTSVQIL
jgi:hypothetical protein